MDTHQHNQQIYPTVGNQINLLTQKVPPSITKINDHCLRLFGKKSLTHYGFLIVLRKRTTGTFYIKLYYNTTIIRECTNEILDFAASFYQGEFPDMKYEFGNIIRIPFINEVDPYRVWSCQSMTELESYLLSNIDGNTSIGLNMETLEGDKRCSTVPVYVYRDWKNLLEDGYLEPDYEEKLTRQLKQEYFGSTASDLIKSTGYEKPETFQVHFFKKSGGPQPGNLDPHAINEFFKGNYAKVWAMVKGFIPTFSSYENNTIYFDLVSDPRFKGNDIILVKFIASEYKTRVDVLKDAVEFEVRHFMAKDIIGYVINTSDPELMKEYADRVKRSYATLKPEPDLIHYGVI